MKKLIKDDYIAGMWRLSLLEDLAWQVDRQDPELYSRISNPSWSWATAGNQSVVWIVTSWYKNFVRIGNSSVTTVGEDETGQVCSGLLTLIGYMVPLVVGYQEKKTGYAIVRFDTSEMMAKNADHESLDRVFHIEDNALAHTSEPTPKQTNFTPGSLDLEDTNWLFRHDYNFWGHERSVLAERDDLFFVPWD